MLTPLASFPFLINGLAIQFLGVPDLYRGRSIRERDRPASRVSIVGTVHPDILVPLRQIHVDNVSIRKDVLK